MDLSQISTEDLKALQSGDLTKVSTDALQKLRGTPTSAPPPVGGEPSLMEKVGNTVSRNPAVGGAELLLHHLTGALSAIPGMVAGSGASIGNLAGADVDPSKVQADTEKTFTYQPISQSGKAGLEQEGKIGAAVAPVVKPVTDVVNAGLAKTGAAEPYIRAAGKGALTAAQFTPLGKVGEVASLEALPAAERAAFEARTPTGPAPTAAPIESGKVTGGSAIENARGMNFKFAPSDVASRAPAEAIEGSIPGMKREGLAGSPEVRKDATLHNTATATKEAGKFLGAGDDVRSLSPKHFETAQQPHYDTYRETGEAIGTGKAGSPDFQQALSDAMADQRPQAVLAPKVARVAEQNLARAKTGNLAGPQMVKDISYLRANGGTKLANAFEDEMERQLGSAETLTNQAQKFKDARRSIAQIRTIQDNTTGGQLNLQGVRKVHEDTNGKLLTGPLKVMAEAAAAAPGSMRLPLGGVGSTVKGKTIFEAGKNAAAKVAQKIVPGLNPLGNSVQNQFGRTAGETGRSYLNTAGERVKPTEAFALKNAPGKVGEITPDQGGMELPQGPGPREPLDLTQPPGQPIEPLQRGFDLGGQGPGIPARSQPEPRASHLLPAPGQTAPRGARVAPIAVTPEGKARLPDTVKDFEKDAASKGNPASARRADIGSLISGGKRGEAQTAVQQLVNDLGSPEAIGDALAGLGCAPGW
jgi:hypothetical protein